MIGRIRQQIAAAITASMFIVTGAAGASYDRTGWVAKLSSLAHDVSGTARIIDQDSLRIDNFNYDGGGPAVYVYLAQENTTASIRSGKAVGPLLSGTVYNNDTLVIDLPPGQTLDGYNAISIWCVDFQVNFGSGTFGSLVQYEVTFEATWSAQTHGSAPPFPHFSPLIGGTHDDTIAFWGVGQIASDGIEAMAESGFTSPLDSEIEAFIPFGRSYGLIEGNGIGPSPGATSTTFEINSSHPLVTLVSMIAPSPDWFVGVSGLRLFENGRWLGEVTVDLLPYDAGTDSGVDFTSPNANTNPAEPITPITGFPFENKPPLGTFTFRLLCEHPPIGDLNGDCRVDWLDAALLASNWMLDCNLHRHDPACP